MATLTLERGLEVLRTRSRILAIVIYLYIGLAAAMVLVAAGLLGGQIDFDGVGELNALSALGSIASASYLAGWFVSAILIAMWIYRGHANLRAAEIEGLEFSPGWSIGWFFIPFANLIKPFHAMRELWLVSHGQEESASRAAPSVLVIWWVCYLAGSFLKNASQRIHLGNETAYTLDCIGSVALIASAWHLLQIVRSVTQAQTDTLSMSHTFA